MSKTPYQIGIMKNSKMNSYDVQLIVGNFTEKEAKQVAEFLNSWMQENSSDASWYQKVQ